MAAHVMIHLSTEDIPTEGLPVIYRTGELFERKVEWEEPAAGLLLPSSACNDRGEAGLCLDELDDDGYAGFEARTGTYWRYAHESDPDVFREHCMQILEVNARFTPRSSWTAWQHQGTSLGKDRLRIGLKNAVTGVELSYKIINRGLGYQIKDLSDGRRVQKMLKHDYVLNQMIGSSFKKLDYRNLHLETEQSESDEDACGFSATFKTEQLMLRYNLNRYNFSVALFDIAEEPMNLIKLVELPHSNVVEDTRSFLG